MSLFLCRKGAKVVKRIWNFQQFWCKSKIKLLKKQLTCFCQAMTSKVWFYSLFASTRFLSLFENDGHETSNQDTLLLIAKQRNCRWRDDTCKVWIAFDIACELYRMYCMWWWSELVYSNQNILKSGYDSTS